MSKEIFLRDLSRFLSDIPQEEREQALKYYEDYFEDAGPENEQQVIKELGSPIDIAKQIKSVNHENIEYGQGTDFHKSSSYPDLYSQEKSQNSGNAGENYSQNVYSQKTAQYQQTAQKKSWTQEPGKVALVVILAVLAIPVGIPLISAAFGLIIGLAAVIFALFVTVFVLGIGLAVTGIACIIAAFGLLPIYSAASSILIAGIGLVLLTIGIFICWVGILFCIKFFPALVNVIIKCCHSIGNGLKSFF